MEGVKTKRTMPLWLGLICVVLAVTSVAFSVVMAVQSFHVKLPVIGDIQFEPSQLNIEAMSFTYNSTTMRYIDASVTVKNLAGTQQNAKIEIWLYDVTETEIAYGWNEQTIAATSTQVNVILIWTDPYTVANVSRGVIQVQQLSA